MSSTNRRTLFTGLSFQFATRGWWWTSRAAILTDAPEVYRHQQRRSQWKQDHMTNVEADQRRLTYRATADQHLIDGIAQERRIRGQVRTYRNSPDRDVVPGKQIAGKTQE